MGINCCWLPGQAQYFRDPQRYEDYLKASRFLASINNERPGERNATYAHNLSTLNKLVLVLFAEDQTVVAKESSWFGSEAVPGEGVGAEYKASSASAQEKLAPVASSDRDIIPMRLQPLYMEDWIGLRRLDERGDVIFETCPGEHMQLGDCWEPLVKNFAGGPV